MSLHVLASGALIGDPQRREGAKGEFAIATIRASGEETVLVSIIAFGDEAEHLLKLSKGDQLAVSGRARLTSWTGRDGVEKHGISLVAEQIASAKPRRRSATRSPARMPRSYSATRSSRDTGPLPNDPLDDLYVNRPVS